MLTLTQLESAAKSATSYPELVKIYISLGIVSYTVDAATDIICYRLAEGQTIVKHPGQEARSIAKEFDKDAVVAAIHANIAGQSNYHQFMQAIAQAGVHFYEATLNGNNKRVTYIGRSGSHEESIPV
ncbi:MAG TPA: DUF1398 family protein [Cytophagaceae bacterium]|jgi:uncharacterized protein YbcV (DUF1398 family)|nr:DUF1398 family protein [Cytophagaceae bacterium]